MMKPAQKRLEKIRYNREWKRYLRCALKMFNEDPFPSVKRYIIPGVDPGPQSTSHSITRRLVKDDLRQQFDRQMKYEKLKGQ